MATPENPKWQLVIDRIYRTKMGFAHIGVQAINYITVNDTQQKFTGYLHRQVPGYGCDDFDYCAANDANYRTDPTSPV